MRTEWIVAGCVGMGFAIALIVAVGDFSGIRDSVLTGGTLGVPTAFEESERSDVLPRTVARLEATLEAMEESLDTLREIQELIERLAADAGHGGPGAPSPAAPPGDVQ